MRGVAWWYLDPCISVPCAVIDLGLPVSTVTAAWKLRWGWRQQTPADKALVRSAPEKCHNMGRNEGEDPRYISIYTL